MTTVAHLRKGWCPGALRPMRSGDGLLVRVRPRAGVFSLTALRAISKIAAGFGSGDIDLTNRGNLQLRGISDETFESALAALDGAGLLDASPEIEAVRNVVVDPLSGLDPARQNVRDLAADLEERLSRDRGLWALPGKFGFSFSGGSGACVGGRHADIMISAGGGRFLIALDGADDVCCNIAHADIVEAVHRLALAFVELAGNDQSFSRMRDAVARLGAATIFAIAGLGTPRPSTASSDDASIVGLLAWDESVFAVGVGWPFGRISAEQLDALCRAGVEAGAEVVHTGPERVIVIPVFDAQDGHLLLNCAAAAGLIVHADDIRLGMDVCPGSPACKNATTETRRDAQRFASAFSGSLGGCSIHISGCEKGCARREGASFTLIGREGRYDIIRDGSAGSSRVHETIDGDDMSAAISRLLMEPAV
jgi:precorrin-3B synthase